MYEPRASANNMTRGSENEIAKRKQLLGWVDKFEKRGRLTDGSVRSVGAQDTCARRVAFVAPVFKSDRRKSILFRVG